MKYAYARVSTQRQFLDGNSIEDQIAQLKIASYDELVVEKFTGSTTKRPRLDELIQRLECGNRIIEHTQAGKKLLAPKTVSAKVVRLSTRSARILLLT